jgi:hypothetical protein
MANPVSETLASTIKGRKGGKGPISLGEIPNFAGEPTYAGAGRRPLDPRSAFT